MKILLIGEYSNVHATLAEGLKSIGHDVIVLSNGDFWKDYPRDINLVRTYTKWGGVKYMLQLCRLLPRLRGFDIVQLINPMFLELKAGLLFRVYDYLRKHNGKVILGAFGMDYYWVNTCGNRGYKKGEMIAIKLNLNNAITHHDTIELNSSPFVTLALVRSMVRDGGIRQQDIVLCEPSRAITDSIFNKVHREFPNVHFIDNIGGDGREKCEYYPEQIVYSVDNGKMARGLAKCIVDADYLINTALLKTHSGPGVTLTGKNWYGATDINLLWRQNAHNNVSQDKRHGKPGYKTFVDFMAHKNLGQKTLLFLIDGTYGSRDVNGAPNPKWMKEPFNGDWACSLIVSQDEVSCDAVGMDIIINECWRKCRTNISYA